MHAWRAGDASGVGDGGIGGDIRAGPGRAARLWSERRAYSLRRRIRRGQDQVADGYYDDQAADEYDGPYDE